MALEQTIHLRNKQKKHNYIKKLPTLQYPFLGF